MKTKADITAKIFTRTKELQENRMGHELQTQCSAEDGMKTESK